MKFLGIIILTIGLFQCKSSQFQQNPSFKIFGGTFEHYTGGIPGASGSWVRINYEATAKVDFQDIYFQGKKTKVEIQKVGKKTFASGHFNTSSTKSKADLVLHQNGKEEYGNQVPKQKTPFELKENEAVLSYKENGKIKYIKVENLKKAKPKFYQ